jgi:flagellar assembly factor FliW
MLIKLNTTLFGEIEVEEDQVISFPNGLPGFEDYTQFITLQPDPEMPFSYMQSLDEERLNFIIMDPFHIFPEYEFELTEGIQQELMIGSEEDVAVRVIVSIRNSLEDAKVNLLAPVIINLNKKIAKQVILHDSKYTTSHNLLT